MLILAGDIGGTNTRLAIYQTDDSFASKATYTQPPLHLVKFEGFASSKFANLIPILREFLSTSSQKITAACFGIAGPVKNGRVQTTNLPWIIESEELARFLKIPKVHLLNDLEAIAHGIFDLGEDDFVTLQEGKKVTGNATLIAAGTGLGEAGLFWNGERYLPFACEGGHSDFSPSSQEEWELQLYLSQEFGHVSWERVLSGLGLRSVYDFFLTRSKEKEPSWISESMKTRDPSAVISQVAMDGGFQPCTQALDLFIRLYGREAGNLALKHLALGGVFIGGGIAPKILNKLKSLSFIHSFESKGRMKGLLQDIPIRVILNLQVALLGAARHAWTQKFLGLS